MEKIWLDWGSYSTLQENGEICCPTCGSWTNIEDLEDNDFGDIFCPLCIKEA